MGDTNNLLRAAYERAAAKFPGFIIQRQELRMEQQLQSNQNSYNFQVKQGNNSSDGPNQVLLNDEDAFVLVATMIYVMKQDATTVPPQYNNAQRFTYPEPQVFVGAPAGKAVEYQALWTLWNGTLLFKTGSLERIKPMDLYSHLYVPQSQVIPPLADVLSIENPTLAEFGGYNHQNYAWVEQQATLLIDGKQNNTVTVNLGAGDITAIDGSYVAAGTQTADSRNFLGVRFLGLLIAQGASEAKRYVDNWNS